ncbi:MAG: hypothetical protein E7254_09190 [Lachnospiraceae bacterium]|nr:hypothetical protein [Lachnospiraceae bacterium]
MKKKILALLLAGMVFVTSNPMMEKVVADSDEYYEEEGFVFFDSNLEKIVDSDSFLKKAREIIDEDFQVEDSVVKDWVDEAISYYEEENDYQFSEELNEIKENNYNISDYDEQEVVYQVLAYGILKKVENVLVSNKMEDIFMEGAYGIISSNDTFNDVFITILYSEYFRKHPEFAAYNDYYVKLTNPFVGGTEWSYRMKEDAFKKIYNAYLCKDPVEEIIGDARGTRMGYYYLDGYKVYQTMIRERSFLENRKVDDGFSSFFANSLEQLLLNGGKEVFDLPDDHYCNNDGYYVDSYGQYSNVKEVDGGYNMTFYRAEAAIKMLYYSNKSYDQVFSWEDLATGPIYTYNAYEEHNAGMYYEWLADVIDKANMYRGNAAAEKLIDECEQRIIEDYDDEASRGCIDYEDMLHLFKGLEESDVKLNIEGYQINTKRGGHRVRYTVDDPNNKVVETGLVYGLFDYCNKLDLTVDSKNDCVHSFASTENGKVNSESNSDTTQTYAMTMEFINSKEYFKAPIWVRAYAKLKDGSYIYSMPNCNSVYNIARELENNYSNGVSVEYESYLYLLKNVLGKVNKYYAIIASYVEEEYKEEESGDGE